MLIYLICFISVFSLTFLYKNYAIKKSILDLPNNRSSHTTPTPRGGGIVFAIVWFVSIIYLHSVNLVPDDLLCALLSGIILVVISFIDDIITLNAKTRLIFQFLTAVLALYFLGGLKILDLGIYVIELPIILSILSIIAIIWFINLYNFLDGIDGYACTEMLYICIAGYFLVSDDLLLVFAASLLGFLVLNWQKAKIFMGDVGSTLLGFNIAVFSIYYQNIDKSSLMIWLFLFSLFWFDATFTLFRRWKKNEKLSVAHNKHAYQRLVKSGMSHQKVTLLSLGLNVCVAGITFVAYHNQSIMIYLFILNTIILYCVLRLVDKRKPF